MYIRSLRSGESGGVRFALRSAHFGSRDVRGFLFPRAFVSPLGGLSMNSTGRFPGAGFDPMPSPTPDSRIESREPGFSIRDSTIRAFVLFPTPEAPRLPTSPTLAHRRTKHTLIMRPPSPERVPDDVRGRRRDAPRGSIPRGTSSTRRGGRPRRGRKEARPPRRGGR